MSLSSHCLSCSSLFWVSAQSSSQTELTFLLALSETKRKRNYPLLLSLWPIIIFLMSLSNLLPLLTFHSHFYFSYCWRPFCLLCIVLRVPFVLPGSLACATPKIQLFFSLSFFLKRLSFRLSLSFVWYLKSNKSYCESACLWVLSLVHVSVSPHSAVLCMCDN